jgi:hypothetical protein
MGQSDDVRVSFLSRICSQGRLALAAFFQPCLYASLGIDGGLLSLISTKGMVILGKMMVDVWVGHDETTGAEAL